MTEYIYMASDQPLILGDLGDRGVHVGSHSFYLTHDHMPPFYFEEVDIDYIYPINKGKTFEVSSMGTDLPDKGTEIINKNQKIAVKLLYDYIQELFKEKKARFVIIVFVLNGPKIKGPFKQKACKINSLALEDLYYEEQSALEITR
ncbi:hypothetical protein [Marinilactibacillus sp. Marseille-P9653]|uniref:hypothetical protein n=1 Tax=Marinilactibacillus sp. Marseille-P9653 TaxID=2866583 RepID=UPI001CE45A4D|nr:hypothetical protein [Marinilactibacillus sp. Marseille-P9653]